MLHSDLTLLIHAIYKREADDVVDWRQTYASQIRDVPWYRLYSVMQHRHLDQAPRQLLLCTSYTVTDVAQAPF